MIPLLLACTAPPETADIPSPSPTPATEILDTAVIDTAAPPQEELYRPELLDCGENPPLPETFTPIAGLGPHEDFTFSADGQLVGVDGVGNLKSETRDGQVTLLTPGLGAAKGTRYLPNGDVVVALPDIGVVERVLPDGNHTVLAAISAANGVATDIHGYTWVATSTGRVERIAPNGDRIVAASLAASLDGIALSPDYRMVYFNSEFGAIRRFPLDDDGNPAGPPEPFVNVPITLVAILDGMTTDACGNLYVSRMDGRVYRYQPDGTLDGYIAFNSHPGAQIVPAINFGPGAGGFARTKLYAMNFLGGVLEADVGIEGRWEPHFPIPE